VGGSGLGALYKFTPMTTADDYWRLYCTQHPITWGHLSSRRKQGGLVYFNLPTHEGKNGEIRLCKQVYRHCWILAEWLDSYITVVYIA